MASSSPRRVALLAGCNYESQPYRTLHGCINDVKAMKQVLMARFGFDKSNITLLTDEPGGPAESQPTGSNIKNNLERMVTESRLSGDGLVLFYFSGHGTKGYMHGNDTGEHVEAIVPCDNNLITKYDFRELVNEMKDGSFVFISDSCHSGGLIDKEEPQIRDPIFTRTSSPGVIMKWLDLPTIFPYTPNIALHLETTFGSQASNYVANKKHYLPKISDDNNAILISACRSAEVSYDLKEGFDGNGRAHGAFTAALLKVLGDYPSPLSNKDIVLCVRSLLTDNNYDQNPCLFCKNGTDKKNFLHQTQANLYVAKGMESLNDEKGAVNSILLAGIVKIAKAYFQKCSASTREKIREWFSKLDHDEYGKVKAKIVYDILSQKEGCDSETLHKLVYGVIGADKKIDLDQVLAIYFISKKLVKCCKKCGKLLLGAIYFACVRCFRAAKSGFNICADCNQEGEKCPQCSDNVFLDNQTLLEIHHCAQVHAHRKNYDDRQGHTSSKDINNYLDEAERLCMKDIHLYEISDMLMTDGVLSRDETKICSIA